MLVFLTVLALTARLAAAPRAARPGDRAGAAHPAPHEHASGVAAAAERDPARAAARAGEATAVAMDVAEDVSDRDAQPDASACVGGSHDRAQDELTDGDRIVALGDRDRSADGDAHLDASHLDASHLDASHLDASHLDASSPRAPPLLGRIDVSVGWRCWWAPTGAPATTHGELWLLGTWRL